MNGASFIHLTLGILGILLFLGAEHRSVAQLKDMIHQQTETNSKHRPFQVLPDRLIAVFGLESSGTTFLAETLATAVGAVRTQERDDLHYRRNDTTTSNSSRGNAVVEIQHISLPWGGKGPRGQHKAQNVDFIVPAACMILPIPKAKHTIEKAHPACLRETGREDRWTYPRRFFVNITSHIEFYRRRGVKATAILVTRDHTIHQIGKGNTHEPNATEALLDDEKAKALMVEALDQLSLNQRIMVSYEALMSFKAPYLKHIYRQLGINSTYVPHFEDGNAKYVQRLPSQKQQKQPARKKK